MQERKTETGTDHVSLKSQEPRKKSVELEAVLTCARYNSRTRERRVQMRQGTGETSLRWPWSLTPWHDGRRGRWQWVEQKIRGTWTLCIQCSGEGGRGKIGWKLERLWGQGLVPL